MTDSYITCSFCNHRFTEAESAVCCSRCSLFGGGGCQKIRCPQCGYEMPPPSRLATWLKTKFKKSKDA